MFLASRMLGFAALCLCTALPLAGVSLWQDGHLFSSRGKVVPGDILKIRFSYRNLVRYRTEMKAGDTQKLNLGKPDLKTFSFLPSIDNNTTYNRNNNLEYTSEREFATTIAVMVQTIASNGIISFRGNHSLQLNGQNEEVVIQGQVRSQDVADGNFVASTDIANLNFAWIGPSVIRQNVLRTGDLTVSTNTNQRAGQDAPELT
nr:flagellar basal body L-ring protein FlgH [Spirochaetota bacterium]